ncbi:hypothetical protein GW17_00049974, partial [Ensete ventricosum]
LEKRAHGCDHERAWQPLGSLCEIDYCVIDRPSAELGDGRGKRIAKAIAAEDFGKTGLAHSLHSSAAPWTQVNCARGLGTEDGTRASSNVA